MGEKRASDREKWKRCKVVVRTPSLVWLLFFYRFMYLLFLFVCFCFCLLIRLIIGTLFCLCVINKFVMNRLSKTAYGRVLPKKRLELMTQREQDRKKERA